MISIWLSEKSVVITGLVSLSPKIAGCGVNESLPSSLALKLSHSMPKEPANISSEDNLSKFSNFIHIPRKIKLLYSNYHNL